jgi:hypothetical protein
MDSLASLFPDQNNASACSGEGPDDPRDETLRHYSYGVAMPAICCLGILGNVLNLVVLTRRNMKGTAYIYMRGKHHFTLLSEALLNWNGMVMRWLETHVLDKLFCELPTLTASPKLHINSPTKFASSFHATVNNLSPKHTFVMYIRVHLILCRIFENVS